MPVSELRTGLGILWLSGLSSVLWSAEFPISDSQPATAYVTVEQAELRSGPSEEFYPTGLLKRDEVLEVHLRTDDGWLGIRPPKESFSWVPARDGYLLPGGRVLEITNEKAVSWIGTSLGSAKQYRWQVELHRGEQLAILGEASVQGQDGKSTLWYRIAPPAGEFRWLHESAVSTQPSDMQPSEMEPARIRSRSAKPLQANRRPADDSPKETSAAGQETRSDSTDVPEQSAAVRSAGYQDDVFMEASEHRPDQTMVPTSQPVVVAQPTRDRWEGWHAWQLDDDGLRFTLFDKLLGHGSNRSGHDPLRHDPFSLGMAKKAGGSRAVPQHPIPQQAVQTQQDQAPVYSGAAAEHPGVSGRSWRDPRVLREQRLRGNVSTTRSPKDIVASIRSGMDSIRQSIQGGVDASKSHLSQDGEDSMQRALSAKEHYVNSEQSTQDGRRESRSFDDRHLSPNAPQDVAVIDWYGVKASAEKPPIQTVAAAMDAPGRPNTPEAMSHAGSRSLDQLQIALSEMVAQPPSMWDLMPIVERTKFIIENGTTPVERGQARLLLDRIQEFESHVRKTAFASTGQVLSASHAVPTGSPNFGTLAAGASSMDSLGSGALGSGQVTTAGFQPARASAFSANELAGKQPYDATGWLVPVHAAAPGQPGYALTDDAGKILVYVSTLPGMNLTQYKNRAVGLIGLRGYLPQLQSGHIQAQRVVTLR